MNRRTFFRNTAAGTLAAKVAGHAPLARAAGNGAQGPDADKLQRVAVTTWSLHTLFHQTKDFGAKVEGEMLDLRKFPELVADRFHVHNLELCSVHFESTEPSYLNELKVNLQKA